MSWPKPLVARYAPKPPSPEPGSTRRPEFGGRMRIRGHHAMTRVGAFERARTQKLEGLLLMIGSPGKQHVIAPAGATDAAEQMIRFVDEGLEQGPGIGVDQRGERAQRAALRTVM